MTDRLEAFDEMERLLAQPLLEVPDEGFSRTVVRGAMEMRIRRARLRAGIEVLLVLSGFAVISLTGLGQSIGGLTDDVAGSVGIAAVTGALLLSFCVQRFIQI